VITFLSSPKPFLGLDATNQCRAIKSWQQAVSGAEVFLYGHVQADPATTAAINCRWVTDIETTSCGLPYFNSIVTHAAKHARYDLQIFLNCDILLTSSLERVLQNLHSLSRFLLIGQRLDLAEAAVLHLSQPVLGQLTALAERKLIQVHPASGMDYFIFHRGMWDELPPLIIGRGAYDNALVAYCLRRRIPVIDGTRVIVALHQFHRYRHVQGGKQAVFGGDEEHQNRRMHDIVHAAPNIGDADFYLLDWEFRRNEKENHLHRWECYLRFRKGWKLLAYCCRLARRVSRIIGSKPTARPDLWQLLASYRALEHSLQRDRLPEGTSRA
jgi:hypothetical protein